MTAAITDFSQFTSLRARAEQNDPTVLREAAGQFEALFIQTILKNMRNTALADPIFGQSDQHEMYQDMMNQQLSLEMASGRGVGLAEMLVRQLGGDPARVPVTPTGFSLAPVRASGSPTRMPQWNSPAEFARDLWPHAQRAANELNIAPEAIIAHAALETGWGEHVIRRSDGASSFNLFGIKANSDWRGDSVAKSTLEYSSGAAVRERARFRSYADISATFEDYVSFIGNTLRYASVRDRGDDIEGFALALQQAGYATDPSYARKITRVAESGAMREALLDLKRIASSPIHPRPAPDKVF